MDNSFYFSIRSNYFKVKDMNAFDNICQRYHMEKLEYFLDERVGFYLSINEEATFYDLGDFENLIMEEISCILAADQVCICFIVLSNTWDWIEKRIVSSLGRRFTKGRWSITPT